MIVIVAKGGDTAKAIVSLPSVAKAAKWLVAYGENYGSEFEIWSVRPSKRKPTEKILEAEYEVLP
jgi:hypothetical protein